MIHNENVVNVFYLLACPSLTAPNNGMISCSLGVDGVPSTGDTCTYTCNNGYELTGSPTRTCQTDESWSSSAPTCTCEYTKFVCDITNYITM